MGSAGKKGPRRPLHGLVKTFIVDMRKIRPEAPGKVQTERERSRLSMAVRLDWPGLGNQGRMVEIPSQQET